MKTTVDDLEIEQSHVNVKSHHGLLQSHFVLSWTSPTMRDLVVELDTGNGWIRHSEWHDFDVLTGTYKPIPEGKKWNRLEDGKLVWDVKISHDSAIHKLRARIVVNLSFFSNEIEFEVLK